MGVPNASSKESQTAMAVRERSTFSGEENCARIPPTARSVLPLPSDPFSTSVTDAPRSAR